METSERVIGGCGDGEDGCKWQGTTPVHRIGRRFFIY